MFKTLIPAVVLATGLISSAGAMGKETNLSGTFTDRAGPNLYSVQFPPMYGGQLVEMPIIGGEFELALDPEARTARLTRWFQEIGAVDILGVTLGGIVVRLDESQPSTGSFLPEKDGSATGSLEVTAAFVLEFDDTLLRDYGFVSPFVMTATERGTLYGEGGFATLGFYVQGSGTFAGDQEFTYTCQTSAEVQVELPPGQGQCGDVNLDRRFDIADPLAALTFLFLAGEAKCPGAMDVNQDGEGNISDPVFMLNGLFLGGDLPPVIPVECAP